MHIFGSDMKAMNLSINNSAAEVKNEPTLASVDNSEERHYLGAEHGVATTYVDVVAQQQNGVDAATEEIYCT